MSTLHLLTLSPAANNSGPDELRREIEAADMAGRTIPPALALRLADMLEDMEDSPVLEALEDAAESLEGIAAEALEDLREQAEEYQEGPALEDYDILVPDQLAYYEAECLEWLREHVADDITADEAEELTNRLAAGDIPYEIQPGTGTVWAHPSAIITMQGPGEAWHPVPDSIADTVRAVVDTWRALARVTLEDADTAGSECLSRLELRPGDKHGFGESWAVLIDAPDSIGVHPDVDSPQGLIAFLEEHREYMAEE